MSALREVLIAAGIAFLTAVLQLFLKATSRVPPAGKKFAKPSKEDFLFWTDWTVAGSIAAAALLIASAADGKAVSLSQQLLGFLYVAIGYALLPQVAKAIVYDNAGNFAAGWWRIGLVDLISFGSLVLAVGVGVKVYG